MGFVPLTSRGPARVGVLGAPGGRAYFGTLRCTMSNLLFAALAKEGIAQKLDAQFGRLFRHRFEEGMDTVRREADEHTTPLLVQMARYLSSFAPGPDNFYVQLFSALSSRGIPFRVATTNYDLLIERSLAILRVNPLYYVPPAVLLKPPQGVTVLKIHGSCNFFPHLGPHVHGLSFKNNQVNVQAPVRVASHPADIATFLSGDSGLAPAMALYSVGKEVLFCPDFVQRQQRDFTDLVACVRNVFIIGLRVNPDDLHIWSALAASRAALWYTSPEQKAFNEWAATNGRANATCLTKTFEESVARIPSVATT